MSRFIRDPKQRRSEETLVAVLEAAERLYSEHKSTDIPISDLCERAGASRSSVYARFTNADAIVHEVYERFCGRARQVMKDLDEKFGARREAGAELGDLVSLSVTMVGDFYHRENGLVQAMRAREARDPHIRHQREWLDRELMASSLRIFLSHFPEFRGTEIAERFERSGPMIIAGFRSYLDFPDQLRSIDPHAVESLGSDLIDLVMKALPPLPGDA